MPLPFARRRGTLRATQRPQPARTSSGAAQASGLLSRGSSPVVFHALASHHHAGRSSDHPDNTCPRRRRQAFTRLSLPPLSTAGGQEADAEPGATHRDAAQTPYREVSVERQEAVQGLAMGRSVAEATAGSECDVFVRHRSVTNEKQTTSGRGMSEP